MTGEMGWIKPDGEDSNGGCLGARAMKLRDHVKPQERTRTPWLRRLRFVLNRNRREPSVGEPRVVHANDGMDYIRFSGWGTPRG